jgi:hypothetical protein
VARIRRQDLPDGVYHVTAHASWDTTLFNGDVDRSDFLDLLTSVIPRFRWTPTV